MKVELSPPVWAGFRQIERRGQERRGDKTARVKAQGSVQGPV